MPGKVKVRIVAGRSLPVMDRSNDTTDAYVEVKLGGTTFKTDVCRKSLSPVWNSEWFRFEVDDFELQDEPLQIRIMDHDTYSANDAIGKVYLDLNPLIVGSSSERSGLGGGSRGISGWIPVYDTMHGIRGEVNLTVKVEFFCDLNKYRVSSCGIRFFFSHSVPEGYIASTVYGVVEELVVNDDPEYQWIDKIRTPRASNEARQTLFSKLSGEVQRRVGLKAIELGANAVIGYKQCFDLEGESGIVVRGIGTAVMISRLIDAQVSPTDASSAVVSGIAAPREWRGKGSNNNAPPRLRRSARLPSSTATHSSPSMSTPKRTSHSSLRHRFLSGPRPSCSSSETPHQVQMILPSSAPPTVPVSLSTGLMMPLNTEPADVTVSDIETDIQGINLEESEDLPAPSTFFPVGSSKTESDSEDEGNREVPLTPSRRLALRRKRRDKFSTTGLMRRVNNVIVQQHSSIDTATTSIRDEFSKFVKRMSKSGESSESQSQQSQPISSSNKNRPKKYREPKGSFFRSGSAREASLARFFGRKRKSRKANNKGGGGRLERSTSESQSIGQMTTSLESLPSLGSEYLEVERRGEEEEGDSGSDNPSSLIEVPTYVRDAFKLSGGGGSYKLSKAGGVACSSSDSETQGPSYLTYPPPGLHLRSRTRTQTLVAESGSSCGSSGAYATGGGRRSPIPEELSSAGSPKSPKEKEKEAPKSPQKSSEPVPISPEGGQNKAPSSSRSGSDSPDKAHTSTGSSCGPQTSSTSTSNASNVSGVANNDRPKKSTQQHLHSSSATGHPVMNRRSSESDLSTPPKGNGKMMEVYAGGLKVQNIDLLEFPFITMAEFPRGFIRYLAGSVSARSVKLLERMTNLEEPESRDAWWNEIRSEIRSHCRAFGCSVVLDYEEHTTICDDVCILSGSGTAAIVSSCVKDVEPKLIPGGERLNGASSPNNHANLLVKVNPCISPAAAVSTAKAFVKDKDDENDGHLHIPKGVRNSAKSRHSSEESNCSMLHMPPGVNPLPYQVKMVRCGVCRKAKVADMLLATIEVPSGLAIRGRSCLMQAQVFRAKKEGRGEGCAKDVSDSLPFLEYELYRRLINKLRVKGMNACFGLKLQICLGDKLMVGIATGTAMYLEALPTPSPPAICAGNLKTDSQKVLQFQKVVAEAYERNRGLFGLLDPPPNLHPVGADDDDGDLSDCEEGSEGDEGDNKETFVLEVDDAEDIDIISVLMEASPLVGSNITNIETIVGADETRVGSTQMFSQVWRCRVPALSLRQFTTYFDRLIRCVSFKLRRMSPVVLSKVSFRIELPEQDEMQLSVVGMALSLDRKLANLSSGRDSGALEPVAAASSKGDGDGDSTEMMFSLEENRDQPPLSGNDVTNPTGRFPLGTSPLLRRSPPASSVGSGSLPSVLVVGASPPSVSDGNQSCNEREGSGGGGGVAVRHPHTRQTKLMAQLLKQPISASVSGGRNWVDISPLSFVHGGRIHSYLGNLNFFFIRETTSIRESGGLSGFVHAFVTEVLAIVRAHVSALGGNAMVSYFMTECSLLHNPHKNQGQCVVNVGGDAVVVVYDDPVS